MKIILTQPNNAWFSKRPWTMTPYTLALLNACIKKEHDVQLLDPTYDNMTEDEVLAFFREAQPEIVGVSSISTEYIKASRLMNAIIKEASPNSIVIQGGILPTVILEMAMKDPNVDYWIVGEGEFRLSRLLNELGKPNLDLSLIDGLAYWEDGVARINPPNGFIEDLDSIPFPDYGNLSSLDYRGDKLKYAPQFMPQKYPHATIITSRGCPYHCVFCAASTVTGRKIRYRSAQNVLDEVDMLYQSGIQEVIFVDDNFLGNRKRAIEIMQGLLERGLTWKCSNLAIFLLDKDILELMRESGCYQMTLSIESGSQYVLDKIIKKPVKLAKVPRIIDMAKSLGFEMIVNFVFGFPRETWEQIRETFRFAESINVDLVNFHIATPLPNTELMETCLQDGCLPKDFDIDENAVFGYAKGLITTDEFTPTELEILRAFEWDRINFSTQKRGETIARIEGISIEEMERWRIDTRRKCGVNVLADKGVGV